MTDYLDLWTSALMVKSTAGRGSNGRLEAYGIKKLRALILELAVRGKLVPQDSEDEPASVLLSRNAKQRSRLQEEGGIRKQKELPKIRDEEKKFELPPGWEWVKLGQLMEMFNGRAFKSTEWGDSGLPIIRIQNLNDPAATFNYFAGEVAEQNLVKNDTFLISWSGTPGTSFGAFIWDRGDAALNQHINKCVVFLEDSCLEFLRLSVNSCMEHLISSAQGGVGLKHVTRETLDNVAFGYPPLAEQHRIVAKVDELMVLCDQLEQQQGRSIEAHQTLIETLLGALTNVESAQEFAAAWNRIAEHFNTLFTTEHSIDQLKKTILQLAVMGKLVPQDDGAESASLLLRKVRAEKEKLISEGKIKSEKRQSPIADEEKWCELPKGWEWVRFSDYAVDIATGPFGSMIHQSDYVENGIPLINPSHMVNDRIVPDMKISISKEMAKDFSSYVLADGDVVMARRGEVGRIALVTERESGWLCGTGSFVLRFSKDVFRDYLKLVFRCDFVRDYLAGEAVGTTMVNLNHGILKKMPLAVPPLTEQHRIVSKVDELIALCDALKARLAETQTTQIRLADAIVERAVAASEPASA